MARLIVSPEARDDIAAIASYLLIHAGAAVARKHIDRFERTRNLLRRFPELGSLRPQLGPMARGVSIRPYRLIYDFDESGDRVVILRILHTRRKITADLLLRK